MDGGGFHQISIQGQDVSDNGMATFLTLPSVRLFLGRMGFHGEVWQCGIEWRSCISCILM